MRIEMEKLTKLFDGVTVLDKIDFSEEVDSLAVIGPSGGGKSTLLRIMGGLLRASSGSVRLDGEMMPLNEKELIGYRRKIGFVFQKEGLFSHINALENITRPLTAVHGFAKDEARERAEVLLQRFGLQKEAGKMPGQLSGGQQQRIAIARAIAPKPKLLLLDEPTSALDPEYTGEVLDMINELGEEGINFVIVTHEMGFARHACEKAAFLTGGRIIEARKSEELFEDPKTRESKQFLSKLLEWSI